MPCHVTPLSLDCLKDPEHCCGSFCLQGLGEMADSFPVENMMPDNKPELDDAYALKTPDDSRALYKTWAATYDQDFARRMDYAYPDAIARVFSERATDADQPVLDVGAGTGLVGEALARRGVGKIDGLDISPEMLEVANGKGVYRAVHVGDLTKAIDLPKAVYGSCVSAGTFTHGHVGPEALDELLRLAAPDALFVLGVNAEVFTAQEFAQKLASLAPQITTVELVEVRIYGDQADPDHAQDLAQVIVFRKR
jgi:SAM-dependent methyltransferase